MADIEKVIKGIECCRNTITENLDSNPNACIECPYAENGNACSPWALFDDTLELLKEQQEKIEKLQVNVEHWGKKYMEIRDTQPKIVMCKDCYYSSMCDSCSVFDKQLFVCCHVSQIGRDTPQMHTGDWFCAYGQLRE